MACSQLFDDQHQGQEQNRDRLNQKSLSAPVVKLNLPQPKFTKVDIPAIDVAAITTGAA